MISVMIPIAKSIGTSDARNKTDASAAMMRLLNIRNANIQTIIELVITNKL